MAILGVARYDHQDMADHLRGQRMRKRQNKMLYHVLYL
jgi:hypothetical protein